MAAAHPVPLYPFGSQGLQAPRICHAVLGSVLVALEEDEALAVISSYVDAATPGPAFFDASSGAPAEQLLARAIEVHGRDSMTIATKLDGVLQDCLSATVANLGGATIPDLVWLHLPPGGDVATVVAEAAALGAAGWFKHLGLETDDVSTLRAAHAVSPISAVRCEFSLAERKPAVSGLLEATQELGIALLATLPLCRGLLTDHIEDTVVVPPSPGGRSPALAGADFGARLKANVLAGVLAARLHTVRGGKKRWHNTLWDSGGDVLPCARALTSPPHPLPCSHPPSSPSRGCCGRAPTCLPSPPPSRHSGRRRTTRHPRWRSGSPLHSWRRLGTWTCMTTPPSGCRRRSSTRLRFVPATLECSRQRRPGGVGERGGRKLRVRLERFQRV